MKEKIFRNFLERKQLTKRWLTFPLSLVLHGLVVSALIMVPLITAGANMPPVDEKVFIAKITHPSELQMPQGSGRTPSNRPIKNDPGKTYKERPTKTMSLEKILRFPTVIPTEIEDEKISSIQLLKNFG